MDWTLHRECRIKFNEGSINSQSNIIVTSPVLSLSFGVQIAAKSFTRLSHCLRVTAGDCNSTSIIIVVVELHALLASTNSSSAFSFWINFAVFSVEWISIPCTHRTRGRFEVQEIRLGFFFCFVLSFKESSSHIEKVFRQVQPNNGKSFNWSGRQGWRGWRRLIESSKFA